VRIVLDSNILVRAFISSHGVARDHTLILSSEILLETARVLRYPRLMAVQVESEETLYEFIGWLRNAAEIVTLEPLAHAPIRDRNDIFVLQTVLNGEADMLCSGDRDFFEPPASIFLASRGIEVLTDTQLMRRLEVG
jgi:putative PIN family toxin of toxin-antitoxin system